MTIDEKFMHRCLQLAQKGEGFARPNPMVGAVIVHNGQIIGEGYHRQFAEAHAEVNAVHSVKEPALLPLSTLYVSLEPCAHHGKTPPCVELVIEKKIPKVVIAVSDPNPNVSGKGIEKMQKAGIDVTVGILQKEAEELNRAFFVNQLYKRPYVILKWAQSADGFIDHRRSTAEEVPAQISNELTHSIVHKFRTRVQGIMVGTDTAVLDNPKLTARKWFGNSPVRIVIDREAKIPSNAAIFNDDSTVIVFTQPGGYPVKKRNIKPIGIDFSGDTNRQILKHLFTEKIYSVLIEGGARLLSTFIEKDLWDEAYIEIAEKTLISGVKAPDISMDNAVTKKYLGSIQHHLKNKITLNFL